MLTHLSERVGVGEPEIAAIKVVAISIGVAVTRQVFHPIEPNIRNVIKRNGKAVILGVHVGSSNIKHRT